MTIAEAQHRLIAEIRARIRCGEWTERALARWIGVSQPHMHNVLKGERKLSIDLSDQILRSIHLSLIDLFPTIELANALALRQNSPHVELTLLTGLIGPGRTSNAWSDRAGTLSVPTAALSALDSVVARLTKDLAMTTTLASADVAVIDLTPAARTELVPDGLYVVSPQRETVLRFIRSGRGRLYFLTDLSFDRPLLWETSELRERCLQDVIQGRVTWLGLEADQNARRHRERVDSDAASR